VLLPGAGCGVTLSSCLDTEADHEPFKSGQDAGEVVTPLRCPAIIVVTSGLLAGARQDPNGRCGSRREKGTA
jgi:hypothetical protein